MLMMNIEKNKITSTRNQRRKTDHNENNTKRKGQREEVQ